MRELLSTEVDAIQGGIVPLLVAGAVVLSMSGCATVNGVRRNDRPVNQRVKRP